MPTTTFRRNGVPWDPRRVGIGLALALSITCACSGDGTRLSAPSPETGAVSGRVRLAGELINDAKQPMGRRVIDDASGVLVRLEDESGSAVDSVRTVSGSYFFSDVEPGAYRVTVAVVAPNRASTPPFALEGGFGVVADTLVLAACGEIDVYPNPPHPEGVGIEFTVASAQSHRVDVLSLSGDVVWTFGQEVPAGFQHIHWACHDMMGVRMPRGAYWIVVHVNGTESCRLVFWDGADDPGDGHCGHLDAAGLIVGHHEERLVICRDGICIGVLSVGAERETHSLDVMFFDEAGDTFALADSCSENRLTWAVADSSVATLVPVTGRPWAFRVAGRRAGSTDAVLRVWHDAHVHLESPPIPILVE